MLKLRKVELVGFKSFCEKTQLTFSGTGLSCIIGPNGCGKSNVVDAISWVLGEQSHKSLRAERMADCIFNGTTKRPPMGLAQVTLTLVDAELAEAARQVLGDPEVVLTPIDSLPIGPESSTDDQSVVEGAENGLNAASETETEPTSIEDGKPLAQETQRPEGRPASQARRGGHWPPALPLRPERILDQWPPRALA